MAVKPSQSAIRVLRVFDYMARMQPVTLTSLARATGINKSTLQRDLFTLSEAGWVQQMSSDSKTWELTHHIMTVARSPHSSRAVRALLRPIMERLYDQVEETVFLTAPHNSDFVVIEAIERPDSMRIVPPVGITVPKADSATGKAFLAAMELEQTDGASAEPVTEDLARQLAETRERGYAVNSGRVVPGTITLASAVCERNNHPIGALVVTGPAERFTPEKQANIGSQLRNAAQAASQILQEESQTHDTQQLPKIVGLTL